MREHSISQHFPSNACLIAASFVVAMFLVSCGEETTESNPIPESTAPVEKDVVSAAETVPSANGETVADAGTRECIVYSPEDRSDGICYVYTERVYLFGWV